jgi:hypothetical protein
MSAELEAGPVSASPPARPLDQGWDKTGPGPAGSGPSRGQGPSRLQARRRAGQDHTAAAGASPAGPSASPLASPSFSLNIWRLVADQAIIDLCD